MKQTHLRLVHGRHELAYERRMRREFLITMYAVVMAVLVCLYTTARMKVEEARLREAAAAESSKR